ERNPVRNGDDDIVKVNNEGLNSVEERELAASGRNALSGGVIRVQVLTMTVGDGLAQLFDPGDGGVLGEIAFDGSNGRVLDVARSVEVGLAGAEVNEVGAFGAQLRGFIHHRKRGRELDAADAVTDHFSGYCSCHLSTSL